MKYTYYKRHLNNKLEITTASELAKEKLAKAMDDLHRAICYFDSENLEKFDIEKSLKDHLSDFAEVEQLKTFRAEKKFCLTTTGEILELL